MTKKPFTVFIPKDKLLKIITQLEFSIAGKIV